MRYREFGTTGLTVSEIGLGAWQLGNQSDWRDGPDDAEEDDPKGQTVGQEGATDCPRHADPDRPRHPTDDRIAPGRTPSS